MYYPIERASVMTQNMPNTKASNGGEKITVKFTCYYDCAWRNRAEIRIVFHHGKVFIAQIYYNQKFMNGRMVKTDFSRVIKSQHNFDMRKFGYTYKGEEIDAIGLADLALKMYTDKYLDTYNNRTCVVVK